MHLNDQIDASRELRGFLSLNEVQSLSNNTVLDPFSTLISKTVILGTGNLFYPGVVIETSGGTIEVGNDNTFHSSLNVGVDSGGRLRIGDGNTFGPGSTTLIVEGAEELVIGSRTRISGGAQISAPAFIGDGAQVLGTISARRLRLEAGADHRHPDPDRRGGVLKGTGRAFDLSVAIGDVINGAGKFEQRGAERQRDYH